MSPHYAGYFNPATAAIPLSPLLVALLLPAFIWVAVKTLRLQRRLIKRMLWLSYALYALLVAEEYGHVLGWRWAARHPDSYAVAEGQVTKVNPPPGHCDAPRSGMQSFTITNVTFTVDHGWHPAIDLVVPRLHVPWLTFGDNAHLRVSYRDGLRGRELLNVEIDANDLRPAGCPAELDFIPARPAN